jgi:ribosomal protein S18 acetylase RimI-like enzyme
VFDQYRLFYNQSSDLEGARQFLFNLFERRDSVMYIAKDAEADQIAGYAHLYPLYSSVTMERVWLLNDLFVAEDYRSSGTGKLLLNAVADYARLTGAKGVELSTAIDNLRAQGLYEQFGFERDEQFYYYFWSAKK